MAEDNFKNMIFGFLLISLFGMLIVSAVLTIGNDYAKNTTEVVGGSLSIDKFNQTVSNIEEDALKLQGRFQSGSVWSVLAGVVVEGIFGIGVDMVKMITLPFHVITGIMETNLGVPVYVTSVLLGIVLMSAIFGLWRLIRIGD